MVAGDFSPGARLQQGRSRLGSQWLRTSAQRHRQARAQPVLVGDGKPRLAPSSASSHTAKKPPPPHQALRAA